MRHAARTSPARHAPTVCADTRVPDASLQHGASYWKKDITDDESSGEEMGASLRDAAGFIHNAISGGGRCLVHCAAGISRSATCVLAYLLLHTERSLRDAFALVIAARRPIWPNGE
jgi:protein-tyrosine phosphatase